MPKTSAAKKVASSTLNGIPVDIFELEAKTKDAEGKETKFTYQFPRFPDSVTPDDLVKALTYVNSKKETVSGVSVLRDYVQTALKNEKRSSKLNEINSVLALRADPEKAMQDMIQQMVVGFGVPREIAEANVKAILAKGNVELAGKK